MIAEVWKPVPDHAGVQASSLGRIKGRSGRILATAYGSNSYPCVTFSIAGKTYRKTVHTLVCAAFHGPRPAGFVCGHRDGNGANPAADNLRWCTRAENEADKTAHGTRPIGERSTSAVLTEDEVIAIRAAPGWQADIAKRFGIRQQHVSKIKSGHAWRHISSPAWRPAEPNMVRRRGEAHASAKLTADTVRAIRAATGTLAEIAARFGTSWQNAETIRKRRTWKHLE